MAAMTAPAERSALSRKHLVLVGAGHAHLQVLSSLAQQTPPDMQVTLVAPASRHLHAGMVPGFVAGHHALDDCAVALEPLVRKSGVRWLAGDARRLDANARTVLLDDGSQLPYDFLSVNTDGVQDREQIELAMPGAQEHALFMRPLESFGALWPRVLELAQARALRIAIMGGEAAGIELAMAIRHRMSRAAVTLVTGGAPIASSYTPSMRRRVIAALKSRNITVLVDAATRIQAGEIHLGCGARLVCDVPVIATGAHAPAWLAHSGLALDEHGFIAVDACQRSISHADVFAADDASATLAGNLAAVMAGAQPKPQKQPGRSLSLLSCGNRHAIAGWGELCAEGPWVWFWKNWMDRSFLRPYRNF